MLKKPHIYGILMYKKPGDPAGDAPGYLMSLAVYSLDPASDHGPEKQYTGRRLCDVGSTTMFSSYICKSTILSLYHMECCVRLYVPTTLRQTFLRANKCCLEGRRPSRQEEIG